MHSIVLRKKNIEKNMDY